MIPCLMVYCTKSALVFSCKSFITPYCALQRSAWRFECGSYFFHGAPFRQ
jgi:hypothetical protein